MRKKKNNSLKNLFDQYNEKPTKGNIENTLLKSTVDTVAGSVIGTGLGAIAGDKATFAGIALILAGHYVGDQSGLLRLTGASTMAYGIGKSSEYKTNPELNTAEKRISALKDDWLTAFHLKWKKETNQQPTPPEQKTNEQKVTEEEKPISQEPLAEETIVDLSGLDHFEKMNEDLATSFSKEESDTQEPPKEDSDEFLDDIDFSTF